jgi:hypothetical protein
MDDIVLYPCKKCQRPAKHVKARQHILLGKFYLECDCHARLLYDSPEEAVGAWNRQNALSTATHS